MRGQRHAPAAFTPGKDPVPIVQEAGWAPGPVWTGGKVKEETLTYFKALFQHFPGGTVGEGELP